MSKYHVWAALAVLLGVFCVPWARGEIADGNEIVAAKETKMNDKNSSSPVTMLRLYNDMVDFYKGRQSIDRVVRLLRDHPGLIDDIWLSTLTANQSMEAHRACAAYAAQMAAAIRAEGVTVSLQLSECIGHFGGTTYPNGFAAQPEDLMVGAQGETVPGICCPLSEPFTRYVGEALCVYVEAIRPMVCYIDDDLRMENHGAIRMGCFCDRCMTRFREITGENWTRETLAAALTVSDRPAPVRMQWIRFNQSRMVEFARKIGEAVHRVSPDTVMGVQTVYQEAMYNGLSYVPLYQALAESCGHPTRVRIGGGAWSDFDPLALLHKAMLLGGTAAEAQGSGFVDQCSSEMEFCPGSYMSKSPQGVALESALALAYGCDAVTWQLGILFRTADDKLVWPWFDRLAIWRSYFEKLAELRKDTRFDGLNMFQPARMVQDRTNEDEIPGLPKGAWWFIQDTADLDTLLCCGIPVMWNRVEAGKGSMPALLTRRCVDGITAEEFSALCRSGVILTGGAFAYLEARGLTAFTGVTGTRVDGMPDAIFPNHPFNAGFVGETWNWMNFAFPGYRYEFAPGSRAEVLLDAQFPEGNGCVAWKLTTPEGGRLAVFGQSNTFSRHQNPSSLNLLRNTLDWVGGKPAAVRPVGYERVALIPRVDVRDGGFRAVTVLNCSIEPIPRLALKVRNPAGKTFFWFVAGASPVEVVPGRGELPEELVLDLSGLPAWHMGTLYCE